MPRKGNRKQHILEALAEILETAPGERITTAMLAEKVGVSEAALYRHFPSKAKMFDGLIEFVEDSVLSRANKIAAEPGDLSQQCNLIVTALLIFSERNPGISRILAGDALAGETARLRHRVSQFFDRLDSTLKQLIRDHEINTGHKIAITHSAASALLMSVAQGKIGQFVRSEFRQKPTEHWDQQWPVLSQSLFSEKVSAFHS